MLESLVQARVIEQYPMCDLVYHHDDRREAVNAKLTHQHHFLLMDSVGFVGIDVDGKAPGIQSQLFSKGGQNRQV